MDCYDKATPFRKPGSSKKRLIRVVSLKDRRKDQKSGKFIESEEKYQLRLKKEQPLLIAFMENTVKLSKKELKWMSKFSVKKLMKRKKLKYIAQRVDACICGPNLVETWELDEGIDPEGGRDSAESEAEEEGTLKGKISWNVGFDMEISIDEPEIHVDSHNNCCCHKSIPSIPVQSNRGSKKAIVALIDGGIDYISHPQLVNFIWQPDLYNSVKCHVSKKYNLGYNFRDGGDGIDESGHGTHLAGIIAGFCRSYNKPQIAFPHDRIKLEIMNLKIGKKKFSLSAAVCAIHYAINMNVDIINLSWGFYTSKPEEFFFQYHPLHAAIRRAQYNDILVCTSSGNAGINLDVAAQKDCFHFPSHYSNRYLNVLSIGSSGKEADETKIAYHSNRGENTVNIYTPGNCIESLRANGGTVVISGTSMANAQVVRSMTILKNINGKISASSVMNNARNQMANLNDYPAGKFLPEEVDRII